MEVLLSIAAGLGLSAACGFRVFVPLLLIGVAARTGHLGLAESFEWLASTPALISLGSATALEVGAYYIPWLDNLLDGLTTPSAVVAGTIATASQVGELDPWLGWTVAIVGGGGVAGTVQGLSVVTRGFSTLATGGLGNPLVSTMEAGASLMVSFFAIVVPLLTVAAVLVLLFFGARKVLLMRRRQTAAAPA